MSLHVSVIMGHIVDQLCCSYRLCWPVPSICAFTKGLRSSTEHIFKITCNAAGKVCFGIYCLIWDGYDGLEWWYGKCDVVVIEWWLWNCDADVELFLRTIFILWWDVDELSVCWHRWRTLIGGPYCWWCRFSLKCFYWCCLVNTYCHLSFCTDGCPSFWPLQHLYWTYLSFLQYRHFMFLFRGIVPTTDACFKRAGCLGCGLEFCRFLSGVPALFRKFLRYSKSESI